MTKAEAQKIERLERLLEVERERAEIVIVRDVETGEQREWIVRGEAMPYYTAQPGESATIRAQVAPGRWEDVPRRSEANK